MAIRQTYRPLIAYLAVQSVSPVVLTMEEIAVLVGVGKLADTVYVNADRWQSQKHTYVRHWRALGWSATLDRRNRRVVFTRDAEE